jgi:hypothetical protein
MLLMGIVNVTALLEGDSEEEVFGSDDEESGAPAAPEAPPEVEKKASREGPRPSPRPRPGFAGGTQVRSDR